MPRTWLSRSVTLGELPDCPVPDLSTEKENERPVNHEYNEGNVRGEGMLSAKEVYTVSVARTKRAKVGEVRKGKRRSRGERRRRRGRERKEEIEKERARFSEGNTPRRAIIRGRAVNQGRPWENEFFGEGGGPRSAIDSLAASYRGRSRYRKACVLLKLRMILAGLRR